MLESRLFVERLTGFIGARVGDVDLAAPVTESLARELRRLLSTHLMIAFPGQHLTREQQKVVTALFGPLTRLPYVDPVPDDPLVVAVLKEASERSGGVFGGQWHADFSFLDDPPAGSVLNAVEIPPCGGDTLWANQIVAYETLPDELKRVVEGRDAIHTGKPYGVAHAPPEDARAGASIKMTRGDPDADRETRHPAVRTDPSTGERALNVNPIYTTRLDGMSEAESAPLLAALFEHSVRPDYCCRYRWSVGDLVVWDNRLTLHYATNDYDGHRRLLYRTTFRSAQA